ncbi:type VII secretion target [Mycolicibacterium monacense]|uniref:ESX-1 secretion-associated protein n=1 Tax=Mycolicibacterium monacense TaxID=85693 RepID=A0AAD1IYI1_MYCMB|nr:type VII secretion target [Mycolicibacterium monacense]MDA4100022.1 hypothetical protein [Mycolicibacterium monacense DSM 44395]ORB20224.1 ESX-1 secretion-associated protein [Mycolicibacterium monacense DSM 44395]QHP84325.1 ESX-1 secretion-associated protein [Mycolicibacterium monacense DSM 44395]BBZ62924.1 ESX-1 secretion-associated protein [Mycolicibacterium monacense]
MTEGPGELHVSPAHLRELSDKQNRGAHQIAAATTLTNGVASEVERTHGRVCAPAFAAAAAAEEARVKACAAVQSVSEAFAGSLELAQAQYLTTDANARDELDGMMHPGR